MEAVEYNGNIKRTTNDECRMTNNRTTEQPNNRTIEQPNDRTIEQPNDRMANNRTTNELATEPQQFSKFAVQQFSNSTN
jgi:hypothetical protein